MTRIVYIGLYCSVACYIFLQLSVNIYIYIYIYIYTHVYFKADTVTEANVIAWEDELKTNLSSDSCECMYRNVFILN